MSHSRAREARLEGLHRRQVELLAAIAEAVDADTPAADEQCPKCGEWFKSVAQHRDHCEGA